MQKIRKIKFWISSVFRILLIVAAILAVFNRNWINLALSLLTLFLTFLPTIIQKKFSIEFPSEIEIVILVFIYASMYLGEIKSYYIKFWWWDLFLHTLSGIIFGAIGFYWVYILNKERSVAIKMSPLFVAVFSFSLAMSIGAIWEIFEFSMDTLFGTNMLKSGLVDTMWDLIVNTFGALLVSLLGYRYLKGNIRLSERLIKKIVE